MWVFTRPRNEHDHRFLINLESFPSIAINQLGERYFVDTGTGGDTATLASTDSQEEATNIVQQIFEALEAGKTALDLSAAKPKEADPHVENKEAPAPRTEPQQASPPKAITK